MASCSALRGANGGDSASAVHAGVLRTRSPANLTSSMPLTRLSSSIFLLTFLSPLQAARRDGTIGAALGKPVLPRDRCRDGSHLDVCAAGFLRHIKQELAAAQINGSRPFAHAEDRPLAKTGDRFIFKSELTSGLDPGLHRCPLANIVVYCRRTGRCVRWKQFNVLDDLSHFGFFELVCSDLVWEPNPKRKRKRRARQNESELNIHKCW